MISASEAETITRKYDIKPLSAPILDRIEENIRRAASRGERETQAAMVNVRMDVKAHIIDVLTQHGYIVDHHDKSPFITIYWS